MRPYPDIEPLLRVDIVQRIKHSLQGLYPALWHDRTTGDVLRTGMHHHKSAQYHVSLYDSLFLDWPHGRGCLCSMEFLFDEGSDVTSSLRQEMFLVSHMQEFPQVGFQLCLVRNVQTLVQHGRVDVGGVEVRGEVVDEILVIPARGRHGTDKGEIHKLDGDWVEENSHRISHVLPTSPVPSLPESSWYH